MLYATPYNLDYAGYYFSDIDEFNTLYEQHHCEEFEIQFIDGDNPKLFSTAQIDQGNLNTWFEELANIADDDNKTIQISYLIDLGYKLDDALAKSDEVYLYRGSVEDYAYEVFNECYDIPQYLTHYVNYEKVANDMLINGDITEYAHNIFIINAVDF
jgi:antirestriction protein ArdA